MVEIPTAVSTCVFAGTLSRSMVPVAAGATGGSAGAEAVALGDPLAPALPAAGSASLRQPHEGDGKVAPETPASRGRLL